MQNSQFLIVFEINGVLLKRIHSSQEKELKYLKMIEKYPDVTLQQYNFYFRKDLKTLFDYLDRMNIRFAFFTNMLPHNMTIALNALKTAGISNHLDALDYNNCTKGEVQGNIKSDRWVKDLYGLANKHNYDINNCLLVVDDLLKVPSGINSIIVKGFSFKGEYKDTELIRLIAQINNFIAKEKNKEVVVEEEKGFLRGIINSIRAFFVKF